VRQSERHIGHDPPTADEIEQLGIEVNDVLAVAVPAAEREHVKTIRPFWSYQVSASF
jgi:hypothetical protein